MFLKVSGLLTLRNVKLCGGQTQGALAIIVFGVMSTVLLIFCVSLEDSECSPGVALS